MQAVTATSNGVPVLIEVEDAIVVVQPSADVAAEAAGAAEEVIDKLDAIAETVSVVCGRVYGKVKQQLGEARPNEFEVEFGIKLAGEAGVPLVTKGKAEAALTVHAKWTFTGS